jgi:alginate O-acetyltransferase complex protein AlgI
VFLLTGVWHGANFTFLTWGLGYAVLLILERMFLGDLLKKNPVKPVNWIYTMFITIIGWIIFRSDGIMQAFTYIGQLFSRGDGMTPVVSLLSMRSVIVLAAGVILATPVYPAFVKFITKQKDKDQEKAFFVTESALQYAFLLVCIVLLISETYNPFIYFQF